MIYTNKYKTDIPMNYPHKNKEMIFHQSSFKSSWFQFVDVCVKYIDRNDLHELEEIYCCLRYEYYNWVGDYYSR